jgi:hypothetical protein
MKVRSNCRESENQSRLLSGDKLNAFNAFVHLCGNKFTHCAFAGAAIKITPVFSQHFAWATCASVHRSFGGFLIDIVADANDHENDLQQVRMIVKRNAIDSQVQMGAGCFPALLMILT